MEDAFPFTVLPIEIQVSTFEYLSVKDLARLLAVSKEWQELLCCDPIWRALGCRKYGQYVGEVPTKQALEEYSAEIGESEFRIIGFKDFNFVQEITPVHWLQYRKLFGHYSRVPELTHEVEIQYNEAGYFPKLDKILFVDKYSWRARLKIDLWETNEQKEFIGTIYYPVVKLTSTREPLRVTINRNTYKIKINSLLYSPRLQSGQELIQNSEYLPAVFDKEGNMKNGFVEISHKLTPKLFWDENLFLLSPYHTEPWNDPYQIFTYKLDNVCEYIPAVAKNFGVIGSQLQLYLAEIVCGFEYLNKNNVLFRVTVPAMKRDGHLQFIAASHPSMPRSMCSYFGMSPELPAVQTWQQKHQLRDLQRSDYYLLGIFMLHVATGRELVMTSQNMRNVSRVSVPNTLSIELQDLLTSLLEERAELRPKSVSAIKRTAYFKGVQWNKMARQEWTPKFTPDIK